MALASLYNVPRDSKGFAQFSFANADEHTKIDDTIQRAFGVQITRYILDPIPLQDIGAWLQTHQALHNQEGAAIGIVVPDFTDLDIRDTSQVANWIALHAEFHVQAANFLRLT